MPQHAHSDPVVAYEAARKQVNFYNIDNSIMLEKVKKQHWLKYDPKSIGISEEAAREMITNWYDHGERNCPIVFNYLTEALILPDNLPTSDEGKYVKLKWSLAQLDTILTDSYLELEAQIYRKESGYTLYRLKDPKVVSLKAHRLISIYPVINGQFDPTENNFGVIDRMIAPVKNADSKPATLSLSSLIVSSKSEGEQRIALAFDKFATLPNLKCKALVVFREKLKPLLQQKNCLSCHGDNQVGEAFRMNVSDEDLCLEVTSRTDLKFPDMSVFLAYPLKGEGGHQKLNYVDAREFKENFFRWVNEEFK